MEQAESGRIVEAIAQRREGSRWVLACGEEEIHMNDSEAPEGLGEGDAVRVFLHPDRRGNLTATSLLPRMEVGSYGWAEVIDTDGRDGIRTDIGSSVEVIVNPADMPKIRGLWPKPGDRLYMTLRTDKGGNLFGRLVTEERIMDEFVDAPASIFNKNLKARPYRLLPVGAFMLSEPEKYRVFVHHTEMKFEPRLGQELDVRIIGVRDDGSLNGSLLPRKEERIGDDAETVLRYLNGAGGKMPFGDKSTPDEIEEMFGMSKAAFKRALGKLFKERRIIQEDGWTYLKESRE
ncbi:CvfB family protein [Bhargavaea cecembensis]|uniref:CvfB family protein n=1 Tax=Bhargavaea cecembensis TaxID=394098 RepID=UPI0015CF764B|nr:S1-like domain-containing RNA-binding protein [Bhargavaea cecembensis]